MVRRINNALEKHSFNLYTSDYMPCCNAANLIDTQTGTAIAL